MRKILLLNTEVGTSWAARSPLLADLKPFSEIALQVTTGWQVSIFGFVSSSYLSSTYFIIFYKMIFT